MLIVHAASAIPEPLLRESREQATAWLAPLPPQPVSYDEEMRVSPAAGMRDVRVIRSVLREPMIVMFGSAIFTLEGLSCVHPLEYRPSMGDWQEVNSWVTVALRRQTSASA